MVTNSEKSTPEVDRLFQDPELLRTVLEAMPGAVFISEWQEGRGLRYERTFESRSIESFTGIAPEALLSHPGTFLDLVHPDDRRAMLDALYEAVHADEEKEVTYRLRHAGTGEMRWIHERLRSVRTQDPERILIVGVMMDISRYRRTEDELRQAKERMRILVEGTPYLFFYTQNERGDVTYVSPSVEQITGYSVEEWLGQRHWFATDSNINQPAREASRAHLRGCPSRGPTLVEIRKKDGERAVLEIYENPVIQDGKVVGLQGVARDVTEQRRLQEALLESTKMEAVGRLAAGLAHDFNNMLQGIVTCAELIAGEAEEERPRAWAAEILDMADRGRQLVRHLLAYSRQQVLQPEVLDLNRAIREARPLIQRLLGDDIRVVLDLAEGLPPIVADTTQLGQVLLNLASNSREAMPGGGTFTLKTRLGEKKGNDPFPPIVLTVSDTGEGIASEIQREIFEPYFTTRRDSGGTGLGLASVRGIVEQHRGSIEVRSQPGEGATFEIRFPAAAHKEAPPLQAAPARPTPSRSGSGPGGGTVLLVEDHPEVRKAMQEVLEGFGVQTTAVASVAEAREVLDGGAVDLLLTDLQLPDGSGLDLIAGLRESRNPPIPAILMSGYPRGGLPGGADSLPDGVQFLEKPVTAGTIVEAIRRALGWG